MAESLSVNTKHFSKELRKFAYKGNDDFKKGHVLSVEMTKRLWLPVEANDDEVEDPFRTVTVRFRADCEQERNEKYRPTYIYELSSEAERSIKSIPEHILEEIQKSNGYDMLEKINNARPNELSESAYIGFETSDIDLCDNEIGVAQSYSVSVGNTVVFERDDDEVLHSSDGELLWIPKDESLKGEPRLFVEQRPEQGRLKMDELERLMADIAFACIVDPFSDEYNALTNVEGAIHKMRAIMEILSKGVNVARLYDL